MGFCEEFVEAFRSGNHINWTKQFLSTFSKFEEKFYANSYDFGRFDDCLKIKSDDFKGKYCLVQYYSTLDNITQVPPYRTPFNLGWKNISSRFGGAICIPSICSETEIVPQLMKSLFNGTNFILAEDYNQVDYCQQKNHFSMTISGILGIIFLMSLLALVILGTLTTNKKSLLSCFCMIENLKNLVKIRPDDQLSYLRGYKSTFYLVMILMHAPIIGYYTPNKDSQNLLRLRDGLAKGLVLPSLSGMSVFIIIGTMLGARGTIRMIKKKKFNIPILYLMRLVHILPSVACILLVEKFIMERWLALNINAPFFYPARLKETNTAFWSPLLFIQNFYPDQLSIRYCIFYYLSLDFQLFLLTPFATYLVWTHRTLAKALFFVFNGIAIAINLSFLLHNVSAFKTIQFFEYESKFFCDFTVQTHFYLVPWMFAIMLGYVIETKESLSLEKWKMLLIAFVILLIASNLGWILNISGSQKFIFADLLLDKYIWVFWVMSHILSMHYGYVNWLKALFSLRFWTVIEKLGLCLIVAHGFVIKWFFHLKRKESTLTVMDNLQNGAQILTFSLLLALVLNVLVTQPINNLYKHWISRRTTEV